MNISIIWTGSLFRDPCAEAMVASSGPVVKHRNCEGMWSCKKVCHCKSVTEEATGALASFGLSVSLFPNLMCTSLIYYNLQ